MSRARVRRTSHGWRVSIRMTDVDGRTRTFTDTLPTWAEALERALDLARA